MNTEFHTGFVVAQRDGKLIICFSEDNVGDHPYYDPTYHHTQYWKIIQQRQEIGICRVFSNFSLQSGFQTEELDGKRSTKLGFIGSHQIDFQTVGSHREELGRHSVFPMDVWYIISDYLVGSSYRLPVSMVSKIISLAEEDYKPVCVLNKQKKALLKQKQDEKKKKKEKKAKGKEEEEESAAASGAKEGNGMDGDYDFNQDFAESDCGLAADVRSLRMKGAESAGDDN